MGNIFRSNQLTIVVSAGRCTLRREGHHTLTEAIRRRNIVKRSHSLTETGLSPGAGEIQAPALLQGFRNRFLTGGTALGLRQAGLQLLESGTIRLSGALFQHFQHFE